MPNLVRADALRAGDEITLCGRPETVVRVATDEPVHIPGRTVHVYTKSDENDPFLMRPAELVSLLHRP